MGVIDPNAHVRHMRVTSISKLAPFGALILTICIILLFAVRYYLLERWLLPRYYGSIYTSLSDSNKRGFLNHHIAGTVKIIILLVACYPFIDVAFGRSTLHSTYAGHGAGRTTMGDVLVVCAQLFIAIYIFEILYRSRISPISTFHHVGTIIIGQSALAISLNFEHETNADIEFILCTVWGAFDVVCETLPHLAIILYRIWPKDHRFLYRLFTTAMVITFLGTVCETAVIFYLFGSLWDRWITAFKVVTPILHVAFSATQVHGSLIFMRMAKKQKKLMRQGELDGLEGVETVQPKEA